MGSVKQSRVFNNGSQWLTTFEYIIKWAFSVEDICKVWLFQLCKISNSVFFNTIFWGVSFLVIFQFLSWKLCILNEIYWYNRKCVRSQKTGQRTGSVCRELVESCISEKHLEISLKDTTDKKKIPAR